MSNDSALHRRLLREIHELEVSPYDSITLYLVDEDDIFNWEATVRGPPDTPYEGGLFRLSIEIGNDYPFTPPKVKFLTPVYHVNIGTDGEISMSILGKNTEWSPSINLEKLLLSIASILGDPNPKAPLRTELASLCKKNRPQYDENARNCTEMYAQDLE